MYYTYVLQSLKDKKWYTGFSNDLKRRFKDHNKGLVFTTTKRRPFVLIYYEACLNENDAKAREEYLKSGMGKRFIKNRLKFYFNEISNGHTANQVKTLYNHGAAVQFAPSTGSP